MLILFLLVGALATVLPNLALTASASLLVPRAVPVGSGGNLNANFPKTWVLDDGQKYDIVDIYYRMRDKACRNICDVRTIRNVPSQFVRATKVSSSGCQYALKVANNKELYFYTTNSGQNCYDATQRIIDTYGKSKDSAWLNGPSNGEFYQVGVHDINLAGPGHTTHSPFPVDNQHLGFMHLACRRSESFEEYDFKLRLSN